MNLFITNAALLIIGFLLVMLSYIFLGFSIKCKVKDRKKEYRFMYFAAFFVLITVLSIVYQLIFLTPSIAKTTEIFKNEGNLNKLIFIDESFLYYRTVYVFSFFAIASTLALYSVYRCFNIKISQQYKK
ncbi:MAG: hypothetical protein AB1571_02490 [Nanoarchaeota archaeon]